MDQRVCLECGAPVLGRADKRFCSDQCRTAYNNRLNSDTTNYMRKVNRILRKNRRILAALNPDGKARVSRKKLQALGFHFNFYTNTYRTKSGKIYYFCYEQGFLPIDNDYFTLVIREEYVA